MEKHEAITLLLLKTIKDLSQTKWNKLLFFIDGASSCFNDKITGLNYIKLPYGPVPQNYSEIIHGMANKEIISINNNYNNVFDNKIFINKNDKFSYNYEKAENIISNETHKEIIGKSIEVFNKWNAVQLSDFSHELDAWKKPDMYSQIDLELLKNDSFLSENYGEGNFGKLIVSQ